MAIQVRTADASDSSTSSVSVPSTGVQAGDLVLLHLRNSGGATIDSVPSGFTLITNGEVTGTGTIRIYSKVAGSSEPATYTFTFSADTARLGLLALYSDTEDDVQLDASANQTNGTSSTYGAPSVTTTVANTLLTVFISTNAAATITAGAGLTKQYDLDSTSTIFGATEAIAATGATGTRSASGTSQTSKSVTAAWKEVVVTPTAPSNLTATAVSASRIDLAWDDNSSDETKFEVERSLNGTSGWVEIAETAANAESYIDSGLPENAQRFYRVRAVKGGGNSSYSNVANATTLLATRAPLAPRLYLHNPAVVLAARVNWPSATYPLDEFPVDGVTSGAVADVKAGMTVIVGSAAGLDDYGRQRARLDGSGSTLFVGRSSYGNRDGELMVEDNAFVTVLYDRRVWAKVPVIDTDGTIYKDSDLVVGTNTTTPPPVANCGPGFAATIDADTGTMVAIFNGESSFATADGATITGYLWDIEDGSFLTGSAATDDVITASFPAGFRYVSLTVTDSNGKTHTAYCPVYARDPDNDTSFDEFSIESHRITTQGQTMSIKILADAPRLTYPDGTLALIWQNEPVGLGDRYHMLMIGWLDTEPAQMNAGRTGLLRDTTLNLVDVAGRLDQLPGFPQTVADDTIRDTAALPSITWSYMTTPNLDKYLHYLLHWHSTALELADFIWSGTGDEFEFVELGSEGQSLWSQVDQRARAFLPDFALTCERAGRILIVPDPMLRDAADRTATVMEAIDESEWSDIRYTSQRHPRVHWLRSSAIVAGTSDPIGTVFSIAPGHAPGQGVGELTQGEQLAAGQHALNVATGHRYARANAPTGLLSITLVQNDNGAESVPPWREIEPAYMQWVTLTVSAATAAQRGLTFTTARGLVKEMNIRYTQSRTGLLRTIELLWERETVGVPGATVTKLTIPAVGDDTPPVPPVFVPPLPGDPEYFYGEPMAYVLWDAAHLYRTWDIMESSPTWELIDGCISGDIYDGQYVHVDADTVGMWLMTSDGIYWCDNILDENLVVNPSEPLPLIATWPNGGSLEIEGEQVSFTHSVSAEEAESLPGTAESESDLIIAPPANTVRMVVVGEWSCTNVRSGLSSTSANLSIQVGASGVDATHDLAFEDPPGTSGTGATTGGTFTCEWTWDGPGDWPVNKDSIISSPPGSPSAAGARFNLTALANSGGAPTSIDLEVSITVTEIELDDDTIYTPTCNWSKVLPIETVQAAEAVPEEGVSSFQCMANYASEPGYLCVATGPGPRESVNSQSNLNYQHAYFWHTHDYGQSWTMVDMDQFLWDSVLGESAYFFSGVYSMEIFRSSPGTIWCVRHTPREGNAGHTGVFYSEDLGHTWSMGFEHARASEPARDASLIHPFPSATDPMYMLQGYNALGDSHEFFRSTDGMLTTTEITEPTGYEGWSSQWRVNKRTFDNDHVMAWLRTTSDTYDLMESYDRGDTWAVLWATGYNQEPTFVSPYNTPNGWPPDTNLWFVVRGGGTDTGRPRILITQDNFATAPVSRDGNLTSIGGSDWQQGTNSGFALPKVGPNA